MIGNDVVFIQPGGQVFIFNGQTIQISGPSKREDAYLLHGRFLKWRHRRKWRGKVMCYRAPHPLFIKAKTPA